MYSLRLTCCREQSDVLIAELGEAGTIGVYEFEEDGATVLLAGFESNERRGDLLQQFSAYSPCWRHEDDTNWVEQTQAAWPARLIGERLYLAPLWSTDPTPAGRERVIHNPGRACGTGEHPCTRLALRALEEWVRGTSRVVDVGTGSGILAIAAARLGAASIVGIDTDIEALRAARENFALNDVAPIIVAGSADCLRSACADVTVANISATVLLSILDELVRITKPNGCVILTGFTVHELDGLQQYFPALTASQISEEGEWRCIAATFS